MRSSKNSKPSNEDKECIQRLSSIVQLPILRSSNVSSILCSDRQSQNSRKSVRLSDLMAAMYPGVKVGHKHCVQRSVLVPKTMGWLWNTEDTVTGVPLPRKWRPGAIAVGVNRRTVRSHSLAEPLTTPTGLKGKKLKKKIKTTGSTLTKSSSDNETEHTKRPPPGTLYVQKEGGIYHLTMQPIKDVAMSENGEPEMPIQFKIADNLSNTDSLNPLSSLSSSSIRIEYLCSGALRKPAEKRELAEMGTQWKSSDISKAEKNLVPEQKESLKKRNKFSKS